MTADASLAFDRARSRTGGTGPRADAVHIEAEFERLASDLSPLYRRSGKPGERSAAFGPSPKVTASTIYERGLVLLETEGVESLTIRRLAAELGISTRTLYKRINSQHSLIRQIVALHFSRLTLKFDVLESFETTAWAWCTRLHGALHAHPHLTRLITEDDIEVLRDYVDGLVDVAAEEGLALPLAQACCRALAVVTVNDALRRVRQPTESHPAVTGALGCTTPNLFRTVQWILAGVRAEVVATHG